MLSQIAWGSAYKLFSKLFGMRVTVRDNGLMHVIGGVSDMVDEERSGVGAVGAGIANEG